MVTATSTTAVSLAQIAALVGVAPNHLRSDRLPPSITVHTGEPGRPMQVISLEDLARFIEQRTGHLNDAECRLRLAMTNRCAPRRRTNLSRLGPFRIVEDDQGRHVIAPLLLPSDLTLEDQAALRAAIHGEQP
ncbi:hypothetical protein [Pseudomonas asiatica]|uniref:hypothetical protein n=1 Tax=Pseudomonas asiatica TaxID=2219225 RepID=UPI003877A76A